MKTSGVGLKAGAVSFEDAPTGSTRQQRVVVGTPMWERLGWFAG
jgi:hypothetical protein